MPTQYPSNLLIEAAAFDPSIISRLRGDRDILPQQSLQRARLQRLLAEAEGGPQARLDEKTVFAAQQGDPRAQGMMQHDDMRRDQILRPLLERLDAAKFEQFRASRRRQAPPSKLEQAAAMREQLLQALKPR